MAVLGCAFVPLLSAHADTLTLRNNAELNGQVQFENGSFTIKARFRAGDRTITFDRKEVRSLELNSRDYNSGAPPPQLSNLDAQNTATKDASKSFPPVTSDNSTQDNSKKKNGTTTLKAPLSSDEFESATQDTVCLRDQAKLVGRVMRIQKGLLAIKIGEKTKEIDVLHVTTVLVAPN